MAFKAEIPNEGMGRLQERSCKLAGHVGGGEGEVGAWGSLWAHMIGSLISVQLCPSNATDQQTGCQQAVLLCRKRDEMFFWWKSPPFQRAHVLSAGEARQGCALWSYWCECRWWPRLCAATKHMAQSTAAASENVWETEQRWPYQIGTKQMRWLYQSLKAPGRLMLLLIDRTALSDDIFKATGEEESGREGKNKPKHNTFLSMDLEPAHWEGVTLEIPCVF